MDTCGILQYFSQIQELSKNLGMRESREQLGEQVLLWQRDNPVT